jgi:hypothetical protein
MWQAAEESGVSALKRAAEQMSVMKSGNMFLLKCLPHSRVIAAMGEWEQVFGGIANFIVEISNR